MSKLTSHVVGMTAERLLETWPSTTLTSGKEKLQKLSLVDIFN